MYGDIILSYNQVFFDCVIRVMSVVLFSEETQNYSIEENLKY